MSAGSASSPSRSSHPTDRRVHDDEQVCRRGPRGSLRSARRTTSEHNFVFLEGVKAAALTVGDSFKGGFYDVKLVQYWEGHFLDRRDVNDLLSMLWTWQYGDIGQTPGFDGDHVKALQLIKAKLIAMPAVKDLYFPPEDEEYASQYIPNGEVRVIPGVWGHFAGSGDCAVDRKWIDDVIKELLAGEGGGTTMAPPPAGARRPPAGHSAPGTHSERAARRAV